MQAESYKEHQKTRCLQLVGTRITNDGLTHLPGLGDLEQLDLTDTSVTDAGLTHLNKLESYSPWDWLRPGLPMWGSLT